MKPLTTSELVIDCKSLCGGRTEYDQRCWSKMETDPHGGLGRVLKQFFTKF